MPAKTNRAANTTTIERQTMKAVRIHAYGGPEVLRYEDAPRPSPGKGEVLVRVHAAGVNPVDWKVREGYLKRVRDYSFPLIPGWDLSGVVEVVGPGVSRWKEGDEIYTRPDVLRDGAYAEYTVVSAALLAAKPKSVDHVQAAAIPLAGLTAWQALFDAAGLSAAEKILVHAASGGVGSYAVQFAKWRGAEVIATSSAKNRQFVMDLGADEHVDYQTTRFEEVVRDADVVLDTIGGETQRRSWHVLKKGGILVSIVQNPSAEEAASRGVRQAYIWAQTIPAQLEKIAELVDAGKLRPTVETVLPLSDSRRAQEISRSGHARGKIVLKVV